MESSISPVVGIEKEGSKLSENKSYKIDREGKNCNSYGELSCLCLAFSSPLPPATPHCQAAHAYNLCRSSPTLIHLHLCCFPSLLCTFPFCPPPAPPCALSCPVSLIHFTPCCPACSQPCWSPTHRAYLSHMFLPPPYTRRHTAVYPLCTSFHTQTHTRTELYKPRHIGVGLTSSKITFSSY